MSGCMDSVGGRLVVWRKEPLARSRSCRSLGPCLMGYVARSPTQRTPKYAVGGGMNTGSTTVRRQGANQPSWVRCRRDAGVASANAAAVHGPMVTVPAGMAGDHRIRAPPASCTAETAVPTAWIGQASPCRPVRTARASRLRSWPTSSVMRKHTFGRFRTKHRSVSIPGARLAPLSVARQAQRHRLASWQASTVDGGRASTDPGDG